MRICVIGNSHIACLSHAVQADPDLTRGHELTFYGRGGRGFDVLIRNGVLTVDQPGTARVISGRDEIRVDAASEFDALVLHGFVPLPELVRRLTTQHVRPANYSAAFLDVIAREMLSKMPLVGRARELRAAFPGPVLLSHAPLLSADSGEYAGPLVGPDTLGPLFAAISRVTGGEGLPFVAPPAEAIHDGVYTAARFSRGSRPLPNEQRSVHEAGDHRHMNADYGALVLAQMLDILEGAAAAPRERLKA